MFFGFADRRDAGGNGGGQPEGGAIRLMLRLERGDETRTTGEVSINALIRPAEE